MNLGCKAMLCLTLAFTLLGLMTGCGDDKTSEPDTAPPAAVSDLRVESTGCDNVTLAWTAPGDDGTQGKASFYDLRYSSQAITTTNWASATQCQTEPTPKNAGQTENLTITGLTSGATYYFALATGDDNGNGSGLSNNDSSTVGTAAIAWVNDGVGTDEDWSTLPSTLSADWADAACVDDYEYALGTTQGGTEAIGWTSRGTETQVTRTGLALSDGQTYFWSVRAVLGIIPGTPTSSDGIRVDISAPTSQVDALPAEVATLVFPVTWAGSDAISGIKHYDIQVSSDGGSSWGNWLTATSLTSANFTGINGQTYHFRCRAWDNAGNPEAYPAVPDAYTMVHIGTDLTVDWVRDGLTLGTDDDWTKQSSTLYAHWPAADGATGYEFAIGTSAGATDMLDWYAVGLSTSAAAGLLPLVTGGTYYCSVRVVEGAARGVAVSSDGITVDTGLPSSSIQALAATTTTVSFIVAWSGSDALSGLGSFDVQVKDGDGPWYDWKTGTTLTQSPFPGEIDHTYYFRSRAYDLAGNVEAYPSAADASTCVTCALAYSIQWGHDGSGPGEFHYPYGIALDQIGNIYVTETSGRVQKFDPNGQYLLEWGTSGPGVLNLATSAAVDDSGYIYVTDTGGNKVKKFKPDGEFVKEWGGYGDGEGQFIYPRGIAVDDSGYVYVTEQMNDRVQKFTRSGNFVTKWGSDGTEPGQFMDPNGIAVGPSGTIYVAEVVGQRVQAFTPNGGFITSWGGYGTGDGQFANPEFVAADGAGRVYVSEYSNSRIQIFTAGGVFLSKWGGPGSGDGQFGKAAGIAVDTDGSVFVCDFENCRVQKFTAICPLVW